MEQVQSVITLIWPYAFLSLLYHCCMFVCIDYVQFVLLKSLLLLKRDSTTKPNLYKPTFLVVAQRTPSLLGPGPSFAALEFIMEAEHKDALMETFQPEDMAKVEQALRKAMGHAS